MAATTPTTLQIPEKFAELTPDQQLKLSTMIMSNEESGWEFERKFKNPERLLEYLRKINARPIDLMKRYHCFIF